MRSPALVLLFLISGQAVLNMGGDVVAPVTTGSAKRHAASLTATATQPGPLSPGRQWDSHVDLIPTVDPKLFNKRRYRSPRVLFSDVAPPEEGAAPGGRGPRVRRKAPAPPMHRGEYSVCDSINKWVGNLTQATDMAGKEVTVLPDVRINNVVKKQFFYETTCLVARPGGGGGSRGGGGGARAASPPSSSGCRGIDSRRWNSYCTNTHTYVRALTSFKNLIAWRLIRINAACVCVLSKKKW